MHSGWGGGAAQPGAVVPRASSRARGAPDKGTAPLRGSMAPGGHEHHQPGHLSEQGSWSLSQTSSRWRPCLVSSPAPAPQGPPGLRCAEGRASRAVVKNAVAHVGSRRHSRPHRGHHCPLHPPLREHHHRAGRAHPAPGNESTPCAGDADRPAHRASQLNPQWGTGGGEAVHCPSS